jgi:hypothetical protein
MRLYGKPHTRRWLALRSRKSESAPVGIAKVIFVADYMVGYAGKVKPIRLPPANPNLVISSGNLSVYR